MHQQRDSEDEICPLRPRASPSSRPRRGDATVRNLFRTDIQVRTYRWQGEHAPCPLGRGIGASFFGARCVRLSVISLAIVERMTKMAQQRSRRDRGSPRRIDPISLSASPFLPSDRPGGGFSAPQQPKLMPAAFPDHRRPVSTSAVSKNCA